MKQTGIFNPSFTVENFGFKNLRSVAYNLEAPMLYEESIRRNEAPWFPAAPSTRETGIHTGRSPQDKFTVRDATTENVVWWDNNKADDARAVRALLAGLPRRTPKARELFVQDLYAGADPAHRLQRAHLHRISPGTRCSSATC